MLSDFASPRDIRPTPPASALHGLLTLVSAIDYNDYVGRIGIGRIEQGTMHAGHTVFVRSHHDGDRRFKSKIVSLYEFDGL